MLLTDSGMVRAVSPAQFLKANSPMVWTPSAMLTEVMLVLGAAKENMYLSITPIPEEMVTLTGLVAKAQGMVAALFS